MRAIDFKTRKHGVIAYIEKNCWRDGKDYVVMPYVGNLNAKDAERFSKWLLRFASEIRSNKQNRKQHPQNNVKRSRVKK
jgi:hypothetical protein